jgi:pantothenate kinase
MGARPDARQIALALLPAVRRRTAHTDRLLLGVTGPPGAGKSALAAALVSAYQATQGRAGGGGDAGGGGAGAAVAVGMDGFHLPQAELVRRGLADVKGAPQTFDAVAFVALLRRLRVPGATVRAPAFDRVLEEPVPDAVTVTPAHRLVVVEGNYLLLDGPWAPVRGLLDEVWHLALPPCARVPGLVDRHVRHGRTPEQAREWVHRSDEANAALVESAAGRADAVVDMLTGDLSPARP